MRPDPGLDFRLIPGLVGSGRNDHRAVVFGGLLIRAADGRFLPERTLHAALELMGDPDPVRAEEELHHSGVRTDPIVEPLTRQRFGVGTVAGAQNGVE